jgi:hypothetical protein
MAKTKKQAAKIKAHRLRVADQPTKQLIVGAAPRGDIGAADDDDDFIAPEDVEITIDVLSTLLEQPEVLSRQRYKQLKRVGWDFGKALAEQGSGAGEQGHAASASRLYACRC